MFLRTLHLQQFRNYAQQTVDFCAPKTILLGENAQGKTNILEAVELMATLGSHRTTRDRELVNTAATLAHVEAQVQRENGPLELGLVLRSNGRRTVSLNREVLRRHLDFLGSLNLVQFSSLDLELVRGGPERRRSWLDRLLTQLEPLYAHILGEYSRVLRQRNALLRSPNGPDPLQLAIWNEQLAALGTRVIRRRQRALDRLAPLANTWHQQLSFGQESLRVVYAPNTGLGLGEAAEIEAAFQSRLQERSSAELYQGTTLVGPHRDEVELILNQTSARQYGSQGQQRTAVIAIKLAELQLIAQVVGETPLLLLDDVLAELDVRRQQQLLESLGGSYQTLITSTHLGAFAQEWLTCAQVLIVKAGQIVPG